MRHPFVPLALLPALTFVLAACEDGPKQTFSAAPPGAANQWNNGQAPGTRNGAASDSNASAGFGGVTGGQNKQEICTGAQKAARWAQMMQQPIIPPTQAAGINLSGGDSWKGITIEQAEQINCQSDSQGDVFGDGAQDNSWGDNQEVLVEYLVSNHKVDQMTLSQGYLGAVDFHSYETKPDGSYLHTYHLPIGKPIQRDGQVFTFDLGSGTPQSILQADELYRGLMASFFPGYTPESRTCIGSGRCIIGTFGDVAYFFIPALGFAEWINSRTAPQPIPSTPTRIDLTPARILPFAFANTTLKLDAEGPVASAGKLAKAPASCALGFALSYQDFLNNCVQVTGDAHDDQINLNKLLGGLSHDTERVFFNLGGVDVNFALKHIRSTDVVHDTDLPDPADKVSEIRVDQSTLGNLLNDYDAAGHLDLHGTGAVYKEYARLVRTTLLALAGITDGDPAACRYPANPPANFDPAAFQAHLPAHCTGFESFVTPAPPTSAHDPLNVGAQHAVALNPSMAIGLKPGHQSVLFCWDANGDFTHGYQPQNCTSGDTFSTSFAQVLAVFGKGKLSNLPTEVQDVRFFFRQWSEAFIKYMMVAGTNPPPASLENVAIDPNNLFFDSVGSGQFETAEYVDRRFASATQGPTDLTIGADVRNGIFNDYGFTHNLYRGETAIYRTMNVNRADVPGQEDNALLTNVFGSPVLAAGWHDSPAGRTAYYCATHLDPDNCDQQTPPLDANGQMQRDEAGRPLLAGYPAAFAGASTPFTLGVVPVVVKQTFTDIQSALVVIPQHPNPYDMTTPSTSTVTVLVPWAPKQPGVGFPVAVNGSMDRFVQTAQLDFSGSTITANVDYDVVIDPKTHQVVPDTFQFEAVETTDFLGEVFLCQDPNTGELLHARMYSPVANIMSWINNHPAAAQQCGIIVRYSPFNNFPDYITSSSAGVRLGITQGGGFGRVVDVTLYVPGSGQ